MALLYNYIFDKDNYLFVSCKLSLHLWMVFHFVKLQQIKSGRIELFNMKPVIFCHCPNNLRADKHVCNINKQLTADEIEQLMTTIVAITTEQQEAAASLFNQETGSVKATFRHRYSNRKASSMCINEAETRIALATMRTRSPRCQSCRVFQMKRSRAAVKDLFISCQMKKVNDTGS